MTTGHADGVITLDLAESDDARREQRRLQLGEPYRTLLGHLRHEIGHYYFPILTSEPTRSRKRARELFGDETGGLSARRSSATTQQGPPADWSASYVSAYATMHPSEDWAETFSHYLHIRDTLQTAAEYRVQVGGPDAVARVKPTTELRSTPREGDLPFAETPRRVAAADLRAQRAQPQHGPRRPLPVRAAAAGRRQARARRRARCEIVRSPRSGLG